MNVFELSAVISPLVGAIVGGTCVRNSGAIPTLCGGVLGLVIGLILWGITLCFSGWMIQVSGKKGNEEHLSPLQWLISLAAVLIPAATPFATSALTVLMITKFFHW